MRALELSLVFLNLLVLVGFAMGPRTIIWTRAAAAIALTLVVLHFGIEGFRWQMVPGYLATGILVLACARPEAWKLGYWMAGGVIISLAVTIVLGFIMPVFSFPLPTGPFSVGSEIRHLVDSAREEIQSSRSGEPRELMVQIWYPAEGIGTKQNYRSNTPTNWRNAHLRLVRLNSSCGVPVAKLRTRYPVLIFSPAWTGNCNQYTFLAEELASHGYIVVGIDHPYGSDPTCFPDGRIIRTALNGFLDYSSDESLKSSWQIAENQLRIRSADVRFVLDELERLDQNDPGGLLNNRVDITRVGAFGHSFGGAVAAEVCAADSRLRAGIDLDGLVFGESREKGVAKPFMFVSDDTPIPSEVDLKAAVGSKRRYLSHLQEDMQNIRRSLTENGGYSLTIRGASHSNFTDGPLFTPIKQITGAGSVNVRKAMNIVNEYALAFFDKHLLSQDNGLLAQGSLLSAEVHFEYWTKREAPVPLGKQKASRNQLETISNE